MLYKGEEAKNFDIQKFFEDSALKKNKLGTNAGIAVYADGDISVHAEVGCHAYMRNLVARGHQGEYDWSDGNPKMGPAKGLVALYTSLWSWTYDDTDLEYFRFILNEKHSPWRDHIKGREVIWGKKDGKDIPVAVKLTDMNASTQAVFNLLLATRMHYAQPDMAKAYKAFRDSGMTRTEAVFLSASIALSPKDVFHWPYIGDFPYDTAFANMDWKKWSSGKPRFDKKRMLCNSSDISPCNGIWNRGTNSSGIVIAQADRLKNNIIQNLVSEEKEEKNVFGQLVKKRYPLPLTEAIAKLKANQEDWKCQDSTSQAEDQIEATPIPSTVFLYAGGIQSFASLPINSMPLSSMDSSTESPHYYTANYQSASSLGSTY